MKNRWKRYFINMVLVLMVVITLIGCNNKKDTSEIHQSNNSTKPEKVSEESSVIKVDIYSGPGNDYKFEESVNKKQIKKAIKIEGSWVEVEYGKRRGYVAKDLVSELCNDKVPHVIAEPVSQNVYPYPIINIINVEKSLFDSAKTFYAPGGEELSEIDKGTIVKILSYENTSIIDYLQIEITKGGEKYRCYSSKQDLLSLDNPLINFEDVKNSNALITYKGNAYYSSSGESGPFSTEWHIQDELKINQTSWDFLSGITNIIASNDVNDEALASTQGKIMLYSLKDKQYINANSGTGKMARFGTIVDFVIGTSLSFVEGSRRELNLKVELDKYENEYKAVIKVGNPIEISHRGQTVSLSELISQKNGTVIYSSSEADKYIKSMYPNLDKNKTYKMDITFSNDLDNESGYYLIIDKQLNVYANPIVHNGTSFKIYCDGEYIWDAGIDIATSLIKLDDNETKKILKLLYDNNLFVNGYQQEKEYLDELPIIDSDHYDGNEGDSFVYKIGEYQYTRGNVGIDGKRYEHGIEAWIARWNYTPEVSWAYSTFALNKSYSKIKGKCILINSYNVDNFDTTLEVYKDDALYKSYHLTPDSIPFDIDWDVSQTDKLKISLYDNQYKCGGTSFGLVDMELE